MALPVFLWMAVIAPAALPAAVTNDQVGFDVRCMLATQASLGQAEGSGKAALQLATSYYFGRVDSVLSGTALEQQLVAAGKALEGKPLGPVVQQCGAFMEIRGNALQEISARMMAAQDASQLR